MIRRFVAGKSFVTLNPVKDRVNVVVHAFPIQVDTVPDPPVTLHAHSITPQSMTTTLPPTIARDFNNKNTNNHETIHERRSIQSLIDNYEKPPCWPVDTIHIGFILEEYAEGFCGMEVGDVSCQPTFLQEMDDDTVDKTPIP
ncbi:hypothetical protein ZTR_09516 [Talaromyces verruculosus]|nr:hypothetical protein ZTR_09516 [Talaromyces verruculosus]